MDLVKITPELYIVREEISRDQQITFEEKKRKKYIYNVINKCQ